MQVKLLFPPKWCYSQPYLSLPTLTAFLREQQIEVEQLDLNQESLYYFLDKERIVAKLESAIAEEAWEKWPEKDRITLKESLILRDYILEHLDYALAHITSFQSFENGQQQKVSNFIVDKALQFCTFASYPEKLQLNHYQCKYSYNSVESILKALAHAEENLYYEFYRDRVPELVNNAEFVGISIVGLSQVIPGLLLAKMIKEYAPHIHLCIGGPLPTIWGEEPETIRPFFAFIDSLVLYEGEVPLARLVQALQAGMDLQSVPNLVYCMDGQIYQTERLTPPKFDLLPTPDFTGLPLDQYLTPSLTLPLLASRGCYWRKCAFCSHSHIYNGRYDMRSVERLREDFRILTQRYGAKYINFSDESISPVLARRIAQAVKESRVELYWSCDMRFEQTLTEEVIEEAYSGGLRLIFYGLESFNDRVRGLMRKGTAREDIRRILRVTQEKGIYNHLFFITGFPTESREELDETLQFLRENTDYVTAGGAAFSLPKNSPIAREPEQFGVQILSGKQDLDLFMDFASTQGLSRQEVVHAVNTFDPVQYFGNNRTDFNNSLARDVWLIYAAHYPLSQIKTYAGEQFPPYHPEQYLQLKPGIFYTLVDEDTVIIDLLSNEKHRMTSDTIVILDQFREGPLSSFQCSAKVTDHFGCPAGSLDEMVISFMEQLYGMNLFYVA